MRRAKPDELNEDAKPIALLQLSEDRLRELFPVEFSEADPLSAAEPSIGSLVQLDSGPYAVVMFGKSTGETEVSMPISAPLARYWAAFLREVPLIANEILWTSEKVGLLAEARPFLRKLRETETAAVAAMSVDVENALLNTEQRERVRQIVNELPPRDRDILKALVFDERSNDDVCAEFGVDRDYLRVLFRRAKEKFRRAWKHKAVPIRAGETDTSKSSTSN
jgi:RNA polymerase sigma factor (sigma-70 family)